jgi:predicted TIM-barrel fold metal-dependent hydrolase
MKQAALSIGRAFVFLLLIAGSLYCQTTSGGESSPPNLLLRNYRPRSIYKIPYVDVERAKVLAIDMYSQPQAKSKDQLSEWVDNMNLCGIEKTIVLTDAFGHRFDSLKTFYSKYPGRFVLFCGIDLSGYDKPGFAEKSVSELKRCYAEGAKGVGELVDKSRGFVHAIPPAYWVHIDDPKLGPLLDECGKLGMPVSISIGKPQWCYESMDSTNDGLMGAYYRRFSMGWDFNLSQELAHLARAVAEHPKTIFIAAHLANQMTHLEKLGKLFDKYHNLYADISLSYADLATIPGYARNFLEKYSKRILYATGMDEVSHMYHVTFTILQTKDEHFYAVNLLKTIWPLYGLGLNDKTLKRIYRENALKILVGRSGK